MLNIDVEDLDEMNEFIKNQKDLFFENLIISVKSAWESGDENITVASFYIKKSDTRVNISIDNNGWDETLHLALYHFEKSENYEYCSEIQQLIDLIHHGKKE
tara:strand:+ start:4491 stop:4796 length:306 start_codon:yes stop_codon:yes gene_type:complete